MKTVITKDGSTTFYSETYQETYHSQSGAIEEAFKKYVEPCTIHNGMRVLDICFGLGYNSLAAIATADHLEIIGLENDPQILKALQKITVPKDLEKDYLKIKEAAKKGVYQDEKVSITVLVGDARKTIKKVEGLFDAVFFDPFSPPKNPELWTEDFFSLVKKHLKEGGILATYSCARIVRDNLKGAGFKVKDGPKVGRRSPSTIAYF